MLQLYFVSVHIDYTRSTRIPVIIKIRKVMRDQFLRTCQIDLTYSYFNFKIIILVIIGECVYGWIYFDNLAHVDLTLLNS